MDYSMKIYELSDLELGKNLKKFNDDINKELKKQEKPKTKPQDIFVGFKKEKEIIKTRKNNGIRFSKKESSGGYY
jgi:hypothetical protein